jgi:XTP/dITP diphosphohydrolase
MAKLVLATNNIHKITEIRAILSDQDITIVSAKDFGDFPKVDEIGETLEENARMKAVAIWERYNLPALADDTGLEVDFLNGAPGVHSARFAGPGCSYDDNNNKLLELLNGVPDEARAAAFRTVIAFIDPRGTLHMSEGILRGRIANRPVGNHGFGYDPIFIAEGTDKTLAQLSPVDKNRISHRGRALEKVRPTIIKSFLPTSDFKPS